MPATRSLHPSADQLRAFAHGRLPHEQMSDVESHVATCDACCQQLQAVPDDTLVQLAREAATCGFRHEDTRQPAGKAAPLGIPPELANHPRYRVLGIVGSGGMGAVYKAEHRLMERLVALKVINPTLLKNDAAVDRFHREFKSAARLSHPNVVTAFDAERAGDLHFLVMEFVEGLPLDRLVQQAGALPVARACHVIHQAALGLQHAHERGMVHRDIKPQNLMVGRKGQVKVLDFGLARLATDEDTSATTEGMILGTPDYIAPEQAANARTADIRSDIYSLGCTLYFVLTGQPPFPKGSFVEKLTLHSTKEPEPIRTLRPDVPAELAAILARMMAKDPRRRYQTPAEAAKELAALVRAGAGSRESGVGSRESGVGSRESASGGRPELASGGRESPGQTALPPLDPLASLDLAGATPLRPVVKAGQQSTLPVSQQQLVTLLAIAGAAIVLLLLAIPLAGWLWPDTVASTNRQQSVQPQVPPTGIATRPTKSPPPPPILKSGTGTAPPAAVAITEPSPRGNDSPAASVGDSRQYRALFVIPTTGLYLPDFDNTYQALQKANVKVQVAARTDQPSTLKNNPGQPGPRRDVPFGENLKAADYDFIIFTGFDTIEFAPGGAAAVTTRRLLDEFNHDGKLVTAICRGQQVLVEHGELKGKKVAVCDYATYDENQLKSDNRVEADGQVVTASRDQDARDFVTKIIQILDAR